MNKLNNISQKVKYITTTEARKNISEIVNEVKYSNQVYAIGRHDKIDVLIIKFPEYYNKNYTEITNLNANSNSFDFLREEPEIYTLNDLKKKYV